MTCVAVNSSPLLRNAMTSDYAPTACSLAGEDMNAREQAWRAVAAAALRSRSATPTGVKLAFEPDCETAHTLLDLVAAERDCCAWASWTITSTADATVVEVAADDFATPVLQAMFEPRP